MKYFYDCEFLEDGRTIDLISIGIVADDGRALYLVNRDAPWRRIKKDPWLMANVVPHLPQPHGDWILHMPRRWPIDFHNPFVRPLWSIADGVERFLRADGWPLAGDDGDIELWADYGAYDHVRLCQLWGRMIDLPAGIPMFTHDLQQELRRLGNPPLPARPAGEEHNALADARYLHLCYDAVVAPARAAEAHARRPR